MTDIVDDIDTAWPAEDLSAETLARLARRLERSLGREQMTYRECELNEMLRIIDGSLHDPAVGPSERARLRAMAAGMMDVHQLVGSEERPVDAAARLRGLCDTAGA